MVSETIRHALSICFLISIFGIVTSSESVVKTVKNEYGDIYDCVDFYKQPGFDHPLLKNHSFHPMMRPSFDQPCPINENVSSNNLNNATETEIPRLPDGGCPKGTVPIRRIINRQNPSSKSDISIHNATTNGEISGALFAISQTKMDISKIYNGVGAIITVYNPRALPSQYSSAEIMLRSGTDAIVAGWTVNPNKYHDTQTRLFVYAIAGDMHCFNTKCGFISVSPIYPVDLVLQPVSKRDGKIFVNKFFIYKDPKQGMWWLQIGLKNPVTIGFWPQNIFKGLHDTATYAACGGEVYTTASLPPPEMGTGYCPNYERDDAAYCKEFVVVDRDRATVNVEGTEEYENSDVYGVDDQYRRPGHYVMFGGPAHVSD